MHVEPHCSMLQACVNNVDGKNHDVYLVYMYVEPHCSMLQACVNNVDGKMYTWYTCMLNRTVQCFKLVLIM